MLCLYHRSFVNQGMLDYQTTVFLFHVDYLALSHFFRLSAKTLPLEVLHLDQAFVDFMVFLVWSDLNCPRNLILLKLASRANLLQRDQLFIDGPRPTSKRYDLIFLLSLSFSLQFGRPSFSAKPIWLSLLILDAIFLVRLIGSKCIFVLVVIAAWVNFYWKIAFVRLFMFGFGALSAVTLDDLTLKEIDEFSFLTMAYWFVLLFVLLMLPLLIVEGPSQACLNCWLLLFDPVPMAADKYLVIRSSLIQNRPNACLLTDFDL